MRFGFVVALAAILPVAVALPGLDFTSKDGITVIYPKEAQCDACRAVATEYVAAGGQAGMEPNTMSQHCAEIMAPYRLASINAVTGLIRREKEDADKGEDLLLRGESLELQLVRFCTALLDEESAKLQELLSKAPKRGSIAYYVFCKEELGLCEVASAPPPHVGSNVQRNLDALFANL